MNPANGPPDPIAATYDRLQLVRSSGDDFSKAGALTDDALAEIDKWIGKVFDDRPFFAAHDYDWVRNAANFPGSSLWLMQLALLDTLADVPPTHPQFENMGNICIRTGDSRGFIAESFPHEQFKYISLSTGYLQFVKEYVATFLKIRELVDVDPPNYNHLEGGLTADSIARAFAEREAEAEAVILRSSLFGLMVAGFQDGVSQYGDGGDIFSDPALRESHASHHLYGRLVTQIDHFAALHEAVHLIEHPEPGGDVLEQELAADRGAMSLYLISAARNPDDFGFPGAPAAFFLALLSSISLYIKMNAIFTPRTDEGPDGDAAPMFGPDALRRLEEIEREHHMIHQRAEQILHLFSGFFDAETAEILGGQFWDMMHAHSIIFDRIKKTSIHIAESDVIVDKMSGGAGLSEAVYAYVLGLNQGEPEPPEPPVRPVAEPPQPAGFFGRLGRSLFG